MYEEDLAWVHEAGFSDLAEAAARMMADVAPRRGLLLDLGCGGGTFAATASRLAFEVWGVDISPAMVGLARAKVPAGRFEVGDALTTDLPSGAVGVACIGEILNYALPHVPAAQRPEAVDAFLARVRQALVPGGVLLTDIATTSKAQGDRHVVRKGHQWRVEARIQVTGDRLVRTIDTWRTVRGQERHAREVHEQLLLDPAWLHDRIADAGLEVERLGGYDDHGFQEGWDGFLARKPAVSG